MRFTAPLLQRILLCLPREGSVLAAMLLVVASVWGFIAIADEVLEGETREFDQWVMRQLRQAEDPSVPLGPPWLIEAAREITALGGVAVLCLIVAAVAGYLLQQRAYGAMWLVLTAAVGGTGLSFALKHLFGRERPDMILHLVMVHSSSFPSGHAMLSAVVYLTLGALLAQVARQRTSQIYFLAVALVLTFLIGLSRIYLGVHYPTDVLAGWAVGLAWALLCWLVARFLQQRGTLTLLAADTEESSKEIPSS
ncbi:MAG: phosphatase PAP2 family protein [Candidatus Binatia bacterium]|nr:phosphatase PAP2 family protein [Candidatus Binatia bacterium]